MRDWFRVLVLLMALDVPLSADHQSCALTELWQTWQRPSTLPWSDGDSPCNNVTVTAIDANGVGLAHQLDAAVGRLTALTYLDLGNNQMTGPVPASLSCVNALVSLNLGTNRFSGMIPPQLSSLTGLVSLYLDRNDLAGSIPAQLSTLTSVTSLSLNGNSLTGSLPPALSTMYAEVGPTRFHVHNNPAMCGSTDGFPGINTVGTDLRNPCPSRATPDVVPWWVVTVIIVLGVFVVGFLIGLVTCAGSMAIMGHLHTSVTGSYQGSGTPPVPSAPAPAVEQQA